MPAAKEYPIVFIKEEGGFAPVAILGMETGENLFIDAQGRWGARAPHPKAKAGEGAHEGLHYHHGHQRPPAAAQRHQRRVVAGVLRREEIKQERTDREPHHDRGRDHENDAAHHTSQKHVVPVRIVAELLGRAGLVVSRLLDAPHKLGRIYTLGRLDQHIRKRLTCLGTDVLGPRIGRIEHRL
ncbi:MAG: SapC family protein [Planctomycetota bacterium]|nr:SapC family protein [Planctomycetota bacterium]